MDVGDREEITPKPTGISEKNRTNGKENEREWGTWVAQSMKRQTLDFGSGHDLMVCGFESRSGSALTVGSLLGVLSPSLPLPVSHVLSLKNKHQKKKKRTVSNDISEQNVHIRNPDVTWAAS